MIYENEKPNAEAANNEDFNVEENNHDAAKSIHLPFGQERENLHECSKCQEIFTSKVNLKIHSMSHEGKEPLKCKDCGRKFFNKTELKKHKVINTGELPYSCDECGKTYNQTTIYHDTCG